MIRFSAYYYDGDSSRRHDADVTIDEGASVRIEGLGRVMTYELRDVKISPRLGDTVRSLVFADGGKCETLDNDAVDEAQSLLGAGGANRFVHIMESKWRYALLAMAVLLMLLGAGFQWGVPLLARHTAQLIPDEMAYDLGRGTLEILDSTLLDESLLDESTRSRLREAFAEMADGYPELPLRLLFRRGFGANAFAFPDGTVVATDGLIELAQSDAEVLAVLAHEIGHVHHRHGLRTALEGSAVALLVATWLGDVTSLTAISTILPTICVEARYSRDHEWEADTFALEHMRANGIAPGHFADIMERLMEEHGGDVSGALEYIASHPPTRDRIARFR